MSRTYRRQKGDRRFADNNAKNRQNGWHYTPFWRPVWESYKENILCWDGVVRELTFRRQTGQMISAPYEIEDRTDIIRSMELDWTYESKYYKQLNKEHRRNHNKRELSRITKIQDFDDMHYVSRGREYIDIWN